MNNFNRELGLRIKTLREKASLSQTELAERLKISRVAVSQIETGTRKVSAEEMASITKVFNITSDVLLDLDKNIKVIIEKSEQVNPSKKEELRINVPQKNLEKFKEVLLYILNKIAAKPNIGETVLYKLLYFIDFNYYELYEEQLIGATYIKNHFGPTPIEFHKVALSMEGKDITTVKSTYFKYPQNKYLPLRHADVTKLNGAELKVIDEVIERLSDLSAKQISNYSHDDVPWLTTEEGKPIDYEKVFYRTPMYSVRPDNGKNL